MATTTRITGLVLRTDSRSGTAKASGKRYAFTEVSVLVAARGVATFTVQDEARVFMSSGELVDVVVDYDLYAGRLSGSYVGPWTVAYDSGLPAAA